MVWGRFSQFGCRSFAKISSRFIQIHWGRRLDHPGQVLGDVVGGAVQISLKPHDVQREGTADEEAHVDTELRRGAQLLREDGGTQGGVDQSPFQVLDLPLGKVRSAEEGVELLVIAAVAGQLPEKGHGVHQKFLDVQLIGQPGGMGDALAHDLLHKPTDIGVVGVEGGAVDVRRRYDVGDRDLLIGFLTQQLQEGAANQPPGADGGAVFLAFFHKLPPKTTARVRLSDFRWAPKDWWLCVLSSYSIL